ncbi:Phage integrase family protein [Halorubrum vacuolatum]|uniref:Phage integrase family protein n=2 Tax=Halorubrum vacuolatum TaxID=63740 RepID=A0A238XDK6_HALVU|nr:Phage integrase family protein [Halorubrum vacuolatum]
MTLRDMLGDEASVVQQEYDELYEWMLSKGKNPRRRKGIKRSTADNYMPRLDQLHRLVIQHFEPDDPTRIDTEHADEVLRLIDRGEITQQHGSNKGEEYSESSKRKFANTLEIYFRWHYYEKETIDYEWEPKISFTDGNSTSADRFTYQELGQLFDEAKSYGSLPSYYNTSEEERETINGLVAQRLGKAKEEVVREDWLHADWSQKVYAMVVVGYDAGLAPIEIANAETSWYNPKSKVLRIPSEYACKERKKEEVALSDPSVEALSTWLQERRHLSKYDGSNKIWLNRNGNPYESGSLCRLIRKLCRQAGISVEGRKIVWYSLRQTMGRNVTDEGELSEANDQLRHDRLETTQGNYNETPVERRQARLNETHRKAERAKDDPGYNPFEEEATPMNATSTANTKDGTAGNEGAVTRTNGGGIHVDAVIPDTTGARVDITSQILNEESSD